MSAKLPPERQTGCLWLTKLDGWALRETLLPFEPPKNSTEVAERTEMLAVAIYEALLRIELEGREGINLAITDVDALIINSKIKSGLWGGADNLLIQTWMVLHEARYASMPLRVPVEVILVLEEGPADAVHQTGEADGPEVSTGQVEATGERGRPKLRAHKARSGIHPDEGGVLPDVL